MAFIGRYKDLVNEAYESLKEEHAETDEEARPPCDPAYYEYLEKTVAEVRSTFGNTATEIIAKRGTRDPFDVLEALWTLSCYYVAHGVPQNETERIITACHWLPLEVSNGGFHQYFFNSAGDFWPYVLIALIEGGDDVAVGRFQQVLSIFPNGRPSTSRKKRWAQMAAMEAADEAGCEAHFDHHTEIYYAEPYPTWETIWAVIGHRSSDIRLPWAEGRPV